MPVEDEPQFGHASTLLGQTVDPFLAATGKPEGFHERIEAGKWLRSYFRDLIQRRRRDPGDDLISALIAVEESGDQLTEDEIISTCNLLLIAGHESTVSLITTAILVMLRDRAQWTALGADRHRAGRVVEETLRFDPPAQLLGRIAAEDIVLPDVTVPKGDTMIVLLAAGHRDPAANERPDEFDPDRKVIRHLGFGHGTHFCLGAHWCGWSIDRLIGGHRPVPGCPPRRRARLQAQCDAAWYLVAAGANLRPSGSVLNRLGDRHAGGQMVRVGHVVLGELPHRVVHHPHDHPRPGPVGVEPGGVDHRVEPAAYAFADVPPLQLVEAVEQHGRDLVMRVAAHRFRIDHQPRFPVGGEHVLVVQVAVDECAPPQAGSSARSVPRLIACSTNRRGTAALRGSLRSSAVHSRMNPASGAVAVAPRRVCGA